jgi:predicted RNase H-like HicB family nuclease
METRFSWSEEDGGYIATFPDFPGISAFGVTIVEADREAQSITKPLIEAMRKQKDGIPLPESETNATPE